MVYTYPSVKPDLNKYHLCLYGEDTEGLREKPAALSRRALMAIWNTICSLTLTSSGWAEDE